MGRNLDIRLQGRKTTALASLGLEVRRTSRCLLVSEPVTDEDIQWMRLALELAREASNLGEVPVGAVVVRNGCIVSQAFNLRETLEDPTAHAERLAITLAGRSLGTWRLEECTLYVTLEPCAMCAGAIVLARVPRVVYGATDPKAGACESLFELTTDSRLNHRSQLVSGVLAKECRDVLQEFFRSRRTAQRERQAEEDSPEGCLSG